MTVQGPSPPIVLPLSEDHADMQRLAHQSAAAPNAESHGLGEAPHPGSGYSTAYDSPGSSHWEQDGMSAEGNHNYPPPRNMPGYVSEQKHVVKIGITMDQGLGGPP